jgi:threonine dehydratase
MEQKSVPLFTDVKKAAERIRPYVHRTPVLTSEFFNRQSGARIYFKCENFQKVGAFKFRGAANAIFSLPENELTNGVTTHSSGNHAQAVSLAAKLRGIKAVIVMPENAPSVKIAAVKGYGADIVFCKPTTEDREKTAAKVVNETGAVFIHPYNDPKVIAGQGTSALELLEEIPDLDIIITPVGGGGLISGTAIAARHQSPSIRIIGTEPELADDAYRSFKSGKIEPVLRTDTIADGLRTSLGELPFKIIKQHVDQIETVSEESIIRNMKHVWERMKIIIEPSCSVPVAAVMDKKINTEGKKVGIIITGGNVDLEKLPW